MRTMQVLFFLFTILLTSTNGYANNSDDEKLIRDGVARWEEAWNRHDAKAGAALFAEDADFINVNASFWRGRDEIEDSHAKLFAEMFRESTFQVLGTSIRFLKPDVALAHVKWEIRGDKAPDGAARQPRQGIFTQVLVKNDGRWLIAAWHNTNIMVLPGHPAPPSNNLPARR